MDIALVGGNTALATELVGSLHRRGEWCPVDTLYVVAPAEAGADTPRSAVVEAAVRRTKEIGAAFAMRSVDLSELPEVALIIVALEGDSGLASQNGRSLVKRYRLLGDATVGVGGIAKAMQTVRAVFEVARKVAQRAPDAQLINLTSPVGVTTEALHRHGGLSVVGLDAIPLSMQRTISRWLGKPARIEYAGLHRLGWIRRVHVRERDRTDDLLAAYTWLLGQDPAAPFAPKVIRSLNAYPHPYLQYYYTENQAQETAPTPKTSQGKRREPTYTHYLAETTASFVADVTSETGAIHVVNVPNAGAIPNLSSDVVVETSCRVSQSGIVPLPVEPLPPAMLGLASAVKGAEILTVEAALHRDRSLTRLALLTHPLGPDTSQVGAVLDEILQ
jgi:6-phospho-beta-glucosidase